MCEEQSDFIGTGRLMRGADLTADGVGNLFGAITADFARQKSHECLGRDYQRDFAGANRTQSQTHRSHGHRLLAGGAPNLKCTRLKKRKNSIPVSKGASNWYIS